MMFTYIYFNNGVVKYPGVLLRFPVCLLVANYLVMYGEPEGFFDFIFLPHYYTALFGSFVITLIVSEYIYICTKLLDFNYPWLKQWYRRVALQTAVCIFGPIVLVYFAAGYYFKINGVEIDQTNYLKYDIIVVVCFILLLNSYYLINYLLKVKFEKKKQRISNRHDQHSSDVNQIAIVYSERKGCIAITFDGKETVWTITLKEILVQLPSKDYFLINRGDVIHRSSIVGFEPAESRTLKLKLNVNVRRQQAFIVSQRKVSDFKVWYKEFD